MTTIGGGALTGAPARIDAAVWTLDPKRRSDCKEKGASTLTDDPVWIGARNQTAMIQNKREYKLSVF
jgi:hypothetical protein